MLSKLKNLMRTGENTMRSSSDMRNLENDLHSMTIADAGRPLDIKLILDLAGNLVETGLFELSELEQGLQFLYNELTTSNEYADFLTVPLPHLKSRLESSELGGVLSNRIQIAAGEKIRDAVWQILHHLELFRLENTGEE